MVFLVVPVALVMAGFGAWVFRHPRQAYYLQKHRLGMRRPPPSAADLRATKVSWAAFSVGVVGLCLAVLVLHLTR